MALIVLGSLAAAVIVCLARAASSGIGLNARLGIAGWDFSQSWATNLVAVGSLLGVVTSASSAFPQSDLALTAVVLSVFFGALIVAGPITYSGLQVNDSGDLWGTLGGFYLASGLTLWAALGEAVTAIAFFFDLGQKLPPLVIALFFAVVVLAVIMLLRYAWLNMGWVARQAKGPPTPGTPFAAPNLPPPWHLL